MVKTNVKILTFLKALSVLDFKTNNTSNENTHRLYKKQHQQQQ